MGKQNKETKVRKTNRYRLSLVNDESHQQLWQTNFTKSGAIIRASVSVILFTGLIYSLIAFTPLRQTIPGYPDAVSRRNAIRNAIKADSLENEIFIWELYTRNITNIIRGEKPINIDSLVAERFNTTSAGTARFAKDDSLLRKEILSEEQFSVTESNREITQIEGMMFYTPVKGIVTQKYNPALGHPFVDIAARENSAVAAVLDGTVIAAGWNDETGYTIHLQHGNNLVSIYKHNGKLLKNVGDKVKAGTAIALVGNTGSLSTAPHLHFELWYDGEAIDPEKYINF